MMNPTSNSHFRKLLLDSCQFNLLGAPELKCQTFDLLLKLGSISESEVLISLQDVKTSYV